MVYVRKTYKINIVTSIFTSILLSFLMQGNKFSKTTNKAHMTQKGKNYVTNGTAALETTMDLTVLPFTHANIKVLSV